MTVSEKLTPGEQEETEKQTFFFPTLKKLDEAVGKGKIFGDLRKYSIYRAFAIADLALKAKGIPASDEDIAKIFIENGILPPTITVERKSLGSYEPPYSRAISKRYENLHILRSLGVIPQEDYCNMRFESGKENMQLLKLMGFSNEEITYRLSETDEEGALKKEIEFYKDTNLEGVGISVGMRRHAIEVGAVPSNVPKIEHFKFHFSPPAFTRSFVPKVAV